RRLLDLHGAGRDARVVRLVQFVDRVAAVGYHDKVIRAGQAAGERHGGGVGIAVARGQAPLVSLWAQRDGRSGGEGRGRREIQRVGRAVVRRGAGAGVGDRVGEGKAVPGHAGGRRRNWL